jgi:hypothetical protein
MEVRITGQYGLAPHLSTGPNASAAKDAEVIVAIKKWFSKNGHIAVWHLVSDLAQTHIFNGSLKLAFGIFRAVFAPHGYGKLAHAFPQVATFVLAVAKEAACGVAGERQQHLQGMPPHLLQFIGLGPYHHSFLGFRVAGSRIDILPFYRNNAKLAGAYGL